MFIYVHIYSASACRSAAPSTRHTHSAMTILMTSQRPHKTRNTCKPWRTATDSFLHRCLFTTPRADRLMVVLVHMNPILWIQRLRFKGCQVSWGGQRVVGGIQRLPFEGVSLSRRGRYRVHMNTRAPL